MERRIRRLPVELSGEILQYMPIETQYVLNRRLRNIHRRSMRDRIFYNGLLRGIDLYILGPETDDEINIIINRLPQTVGERLTDVERKYEACLNVYKYNPFNEFDYRIQEDYYVYFLRMVRDLFDDKKEFVNFIVPFIDEETKTDYINYIIENHIH